MLYANILNLNKLYQHDFQVQIYTVSLNSALIVFKNKTPHSSAHPTLACINSVKIDNQSEGSQEMSYLIKWNIA